MVQTILVRAQRRSNVSKNATTLTFRVQFTQIGYFVLRFKLFSYFDFILAFLVIIFMHDGL